MKTLSDLKRNAYQYKWAMLYNSLVDIVPDFLSVFREVAKVQTNSIGFKTIKNGEESISWTDWPKAKNLEITECSNGDFHVKFNGESEKHCTLHYLLKRC